MPTDRIQRIADAVEARKKAEAEELEAILDALRHDELQKDVAAAAGLDREPLRRLARRHGIGPAPRGRRAADTASRDGKAT